MQATVSSKENLLKIIKENRESIKSFGVKRLGVFGSFVRNEQNQDSDVDLLVEFRPGEKTFDHFINLSFFLEGLLKRRVELITPESLSPYLRPYILAEAQYVSLVN